MPKTTAAAMSAEKERARFVVFSIMKLFLLNLSSRFGTWE
jgi:hypothetical protein